MEVQKNHQLKEGTILDMRFKIDRVLGEGGFGITYAGTNMNTGEKVAIKEFFSRDYMGRASDGTGRTVLTGGDSEQRFNNERRRFLREARIIQDFRDEPGIVSVLDYFEENDTAYIAMKYIDGVTLSQYVKEHGPMDPEALFDHVRPLLLSLRKLHSAGVIHRDISPENVMRMDSGDLMLIDFGSAKNLNSATRSTVSTYKDGYAPPEQYKAGYVPTQAMDVYGLCATLYYCITGEVPASSIHRTLFDDLRPVRTVIPSIPVPISDMIARGMSLVPEDRQRSIDELLQAIDDVYLSPEAKALIRKKKKTRRLLLIAAGILIFATSIGFYQYRIAPYHNDIPDACCTHFTWSDEDEAAEMAEVLEKRLDIFTGKGNYTITENGEELTVRLPLDQLHGRNPDDIAQYYLSAPYRTFTLYGTDAAGEAVGYLDLDVGEFISDHKADFVSSDIDTIRASKGTIPIGSSSTADISHVEVVLSEDAASRASALLTDRGRLLSIEVDGQMSTHAYSAGDGKTFYLIDNYAVDQDQYEEMIDCTLAVKDDQTISVADTEGGDICGLIASNFSEDLVSFVRPSSITTELIVDWSRRSIWEEAGKFQVEPDKLPADSAVIAFDTGYDDTQAAELDASISAFKARLDALNTPYAFGKLHFDSSIIVIKMPIDAIKESELMMLDANEFPHVSNGYTDFLLSSVDDIRMGQNDAACLELSLQDYEIENITGIIEQNERTGLDHIYLKYGDIPVAYANTEEVKASFEEGKITFSKLCTEGLGNDPERSKRHLQFVKAVTEHAFLHRMELYTIEIHDSSGRYEKTGAYSYFTGNCYTGLRALSDSLQDILKDSDCEVTFYFSSQTGALSFRSSGVSTAEFEKEVIDCVEKVLASPELYSNDIQAGFLKFSFSNRDSRIDKDHYLTTTIMLVPALTGDDSDITDGVRYKLSSSVKSIRVDAYGPENINVRDPQETASATKRLIDALEAAGFEYVYPEG